MNQANETVKEQQPGGARGSGVAREKAARESSGGGLLSRADGAWQTPPHGNGNR